MKKNVTTGVLLICACLAVAMAVPRIEQMAQDGRESVVETDIQEEAEPAWQEEKPNSSHTEGGGCAHEVLW